MGNISNPDRIRLENDFFAHVNKEYLAVDLDNGVLADARQLLLQHPLRTLDAIQLASALNFARAVAITPTFVSADVNLLTAAAAEGLPTDNPNAHP